MDWQTIASQIPVVVVFVFFVLFMFDKFLKEMARKDKFLEAAIDKLMEDANTRGATRDQNFIHSFKELTEAHNKGLARLATSIKKCEAVEMLKRKGV